ncbi:hypothetical protein TWF281_008395 [Arthrobotrys megalospora]
MLTRASTPSNVTHHSLNPIKMSTPVALPPFLRLPREVRNEIYKYLLCFPLPSLPGPAPFKKFDYPRRFERRPSQFEDPGRNIAILRVNKQIHEEAAETLYSSNTFLVQITTAPGSDIVSHRLRSTDLTALYDSPWETLGYFSQDKLIGRFVPYTYGTFVHCPLRLKSYSYMPRDVCWCSKCVEHIKESARFPVPALRYRHLIRRIRVDLFETSMARRGNDGDERIKRLLLPFRYRLEEALKPASEEVAVEITAATLNYENGEEFAIESEEMFSELIKTLWPLTIGPWKSTIKLPNDLQQQYGHLTESVLKKCSDETAISKKEEQHFRAVDIESDCLRVRNRGVYVLDIPDFFPIYGRNAHSYMELCQCPKKAVTSKAPESGPASRRQSRFWSGITQGTRKIRDSIKKPSS